MPLREQLEQVIAPLRNLAGSTEPEFLKLGERLQEIVARAGGQRAAIGRLMESAERTSHGSLVTLLEEISRWAGQAEGGGGEADRFESLLTTVGSVRDPLGGLGNALRTLRVVSVVTRVESARLGLQGAGFEALAGEVNSLAEMIDEKSRAILEAVEDVAGLLARTRQNAAAVQRREQAAIAVMAGECSASAGRLELQVGSVARVSRGLAEEWDSFTADVGNIVAALQIHDNTRQRLEHITEALEHGGDETAGAAAGHLIELQAVQLEQARDAFLHAIGGIQTDLHRVQQMMSECVAMAEEVSGSHGGSAQSFAGDLERRLEAMAATVSQLAESRRAIALAARDVQQACGRMSGFVTEIETIAERMLRLALNAQIQAVHLAETGVVMEAVAEGIRSSSVRACDSARVAGQALRDVETAASGMNALSGGGSEADVAAAAALKERIAGSMGELTATDCENARALAAVAEESRSFSDEIAALAAGIGSGGVVDEVAGSAVGTLRELAGRLMPRGAEAAAHAEALAAASEKYTMHAEREAHDAFLGVRPSAGDTGAGGEIGDNVELF